MFLGSVLNNISSTIVEKALVDDVLWYRAVIKSIEGENAAVQLSQNQIAKKVKQEFIDVRMTFVCVHSERVSLFLSFDGIIGASACSACGHTLYAFWPPLLCPLFSCNVSVCTLFILTNRPSFFGVCVSVADTFISIVLC